MNDREKPTLTAWRLREIVRIMVRGKHGSECDCLDHYKDGERLLKATEEWAEDFCSFCEQPEGYHERGCLGGNKRRAVPPAPVKTKEDK